MSSGEQFKKDVERGLNSGEKFLSSRYFYDKEGDLLFQQIMDLDEYYLTNCEYEILETYREDLLDSFASECDKFHLIEFGAGDGLKTKVLINHFIEQDASFEYNPIDISANVLDKLKKDLLQEYPGLVCNPINLEYFEAVEEVSRHDTCKKVVLFLGSNIGNLGMHDADGFFSQLASVLAVGDQVLTGFDLKKDPEVILAAYNDSKGITREFNLNLLKRINRELDANFDPEGFSHAPVYTPEDGAARSYLVSDRKQKVDIRGIPLTVEFKEGEEIFMEISQKYSLEQIRGFADRNGFRLIRNYLDSRNYFANSLWEKI